MNANQGTAGHHASAAIHHGQSMRFHREAGRHYQIGKDYAHAAHQSLVAHGHTMQAMEHARKACENYAEHGGDPLPKYLDRAEAAGATLNGAQHHAAAADHEEQAARHHALAAGHFAAQDFIAAAKDAGSAHVHAGISVFHSNEAAKHHIRHNGGPAGLQTAPERPAMA